MKATPVDRSRTSVAPYPPSSRASRSARPRGALARNCADELLTYEYKVIRVQTWIALTVLNSAISIPGKTPFGTIFNRILKVVEIFDCRFIVEIEYLRDTNIHL